MFELDGGIVVLVFHLTGVHTGVHPADFFHVQLRAFVPIFWA